MSFEAHYRIEEGRYEGRALLTTGNVTRKIIPLTASTEERAWAQEHDARNKLYNESPFPLSIVVLEKIITC